MLNDKTTYDVIVGEEQAVEIDFSANPRGSVILPAVYITKNGKLSEILPQSTTIMIEVKR